MKNKSPTLPLFFIIWFFGATFVSIATYHSALELRDENKTALIETKFREMNEQLNTTVATHFDHLRTLTNNPHIRKLFNNGIPDNPETLALLTGLKEITHSSIIYILDNKGTVISCSTYDTNKSLTGKSYGFRPYFTKAIKGEETLYPALGVTTGKRGLYLSAPIKTENDLIQGVAVIKLSLKEFDLILQNQEGINLLISPNGVIFAGNKKEWLFQTTHKLSDTTHAQLIASQQFNSKPLPPLDLDLNQPTITIDTNTYSTFSSPLAINGWQVIRCSNVKTHINLKPVQRKLLFSQFIFTILLLTIIILLIKNILKLKLAKIALKEHQDHLEETIKDRTIELTKANTSLTKANKAKSEFLANMSHEIRTPMNAIIGFTDLLLTSTITTQQKQHLNTISQAGTNLLSLINDILDFSKIDAGKLDIEICPFNLSQVIDMVVNLNKEKAEAKDLRLETDLPQLSRQLQSDPTRISQILTNLLANSIKFTEEGSITLTVAIQKEDEKEVTLLFKVKDSGIGISEDQQKNIFDKFTQADASVTRNYGGTGLGLTISNQLIGLLGGTYLHVESSPGQGAIFSFTLSFLFGPSITNHLVEDKKNAGTPLPPCKILLVEDNLVNIKLATIILEKKGHTIITAENGELGVACYKKESFDLIFMDMQMPVMDGIKATKMIRALEQKETSNWPYTPIIAMTANAMKGDRERCLDAGMDDYITKPIKLDNIISVIKRVLKHLKHQQDN